MSSESADDIDRWKSPLREALTALALPAQEQVRVTEPGCVACELLNDFDIAHKDYCERCAGAVTETQRSILEEIDHLMDTMQEPDYTCFDNRVLERPVWETLRQRARKALKILGWPYVTIEGYQQVSESVWRRPPLESPRGDQGSGVTTIHQHQRLEHYRQIQARLELLAPDRTYRVDRSGSWNQLADTYALWKSLMRVAGKDLAVRPMVRLLAECCQFVHSNPGLSVEERSEAERVLAVVHGTIASITIRLAERSATTAKDVRGKIEDLEQLRIRPFSIGGYLRLATQSVAMAAVSPGRYWSDLLMGLHQLSATDDLGYRSFHEANVRYLRLLSEELRHRMSAAESDG